MRQDRYHIPMEDLSAFSMERSEDLEDWEDVVHAELESVLDAEPEEKTRTFIEVVRGGGMCRLQGYFYRIQPR